MKVDLMNVSECTNDMVVARDIIDKTGKIIIKADTCINSYVLKKLYKFDIKKIYTYKDTLSLIDEPQVLQNQKEYDDMTGIVKNIFGDIALGKNIRLKDLEALANDILNDIVLNHNLIKYLKSIRTIDEYTYTHSINVAALSILLANWLSYDHKDIKRLAQAAILHDVGKIRVPPEILNKPSSLTEEELSIMKQHSQYGYNIVKENSAIDQSIANSVLYHHERYDGSGYPNELKDSTIPECAKIISVCDVYDAMTANRVYRGKVCPIKVLKLMYLDKVGIFDNMIKKLFIRNVIMFFQGEDVLFKDGNIGKLIFIDNEPPYNMIIKVEDGVITSDVTREDDFELIRSIV